MADKDETPEEYRTRMAAGFAGKTFPVGCVDLPVSVAMAPDGQIAVLFAGALMGFDQAIQMCVFLTPEAAQALATLILSGQLQPDTPVELRPERPSN